MARELLAEGRMTEENQNPNDVYAATQNVCIGELLERWKNGLSIGKDARVENVHLHDGEGNLVGFRLYLVVGEPPVLGKAPVEVIEAVASA